MRAQVYKIHSDFYYVKNLEHSEFVCKLRDVLKKQKIDIRVGDFVELSEDNNFIISLLDRKNCLDRPKVSNIDLVLIVCALKEPELDLMQLNRYLTYLKYYNVDCAICFNKEDLVENDTLHEINLYLEYYRKIGYTVVSNTDLDKIKELINNKTSVFTGQTGAGKSSLLNKLNKDWNLETGEISLALGRGKHTTRVVELFDFLDGKVMDTPGFSALDFYDSTKEDIRNAFIEFKDYPCPFSDCSHTNEGECLVKENVNCNNILKSRYENYLSFIKEVRK